MYFYHSYEWNLLVTHLSPSPPFLSFLPAFIPHPLSFLTRLISSSLAVLSYWCRVFTCLYFLAMEAIVWPLWWAGSNHRQTQRAALSKAHSGRQTSNHASSREKNHSNEFALFLGEAALSLTVPWGLPRPWLAQAKGKWTLASPLSCPGPSRPPPWN